MFFQKKSTKIIATIVSVLLIATMATTVLANETYQSYGYDWWGVTYPVQSGYVVDRVVTGNELGTALASPNDMFLFDNDGEVTVFIADTANNRIIITDPEFSEYRELKDFTYSDDYRVENFLPRNQEPVLPKSADFAGESKEVIDRAIEEYNVKLAEYEASVEEYRAEVEKIGTKTALKSPRGIHVAKYRDEIRVYIADHDNERVIACDLDGNIWMEYRRPDTETFKDEKGEYKTFTPSKIVTDNAGNVYVCVKTITNGAVQFSEEGHFLGYYGANRVMRTADAILNRYVLRFVLSREAMEARTRPTPVEFSNLTIDRDQFIYTTTETRNIGVDIVKKLDPAGRNVYEKQGFRDSWGDLMSPYIFGKTYISLIVDIAIDNTLDDKGNIKGDILILDRESGKVFQYSNEGDLMFIFGGKGEQKGLFSNPVALEIQDNKVYVLDSVKNSITVFKLTEFGGLVSEAMNLFNRGLYSESQKPWEEVLRRDSNYYMAYIGMGNALLSDGDFKGALDYFHFHSWGGYDRAFKDFRVNYMRENFDMLLIAALAVVALLIGGNVALKTVKKHRKKS